MQADDPAVEAFVDRMRAISNDPNADDWVRVAIRGEIDTFERRVPAPRRGDVLESMAAWPERMAVFIWCLLWNEHVPILAVFNAAQMTITGTQIRSGDEAPFERWCRETVVSLLGIEER